MMPQAHTPDSLAWTNGANHAATPPERPVILAATDGSEASLRAGEHAARLCEALGAQLLVVRVVDKGQASHGGIHDEQEELARGGGEATAKVAALAASRGVQSRELLVEGEPEDGIAHLAEEAGVQYVVLGSRGLSGTGRALLGAVSKGVIRRARPPVIVVGAEDDWSPAETARAAEAAFPGVAER